VPTEMLRRGAYFTVQLLARPCNATNFRTYPPFVRLGDSAADPRGSFNLWWLFDALLVRPTPQALYSWRRFALRLFGAKIGSYQAMPAERELNPNGSSAGSAGEAAKV
jgi:hypothetical protein